MKKLYLVVLFLVIGAASTFGQSWEWAKESDSLTSSFPRKQDSNGFKYFIKTYSSAGNYETKFSKFDSLNNLIWQKTVSNIIVSDWTINENGICYIVGKFFGSVSFDSNQLNASPNENLFLCKLNSSGMFEWARKGSGQSELNPTSICSDYTNSIYITGSFGYTLTYDTITLSSLSQETLFLASFDINGNIKWIRKSVNTSGSTSHGKDLKLDSDKNPYLYFNLSSSYPDSVTFQGYTFNGPLWIGFVAKFDQSGLMLWKKQCYAYQSNYKGYLIDTLNNIYVTQSEYDGFSWPVIRKVDPNGNELWQVTDIGFQFQGANISDMTLDNNGNLICLGTFYDYPKEFFNKLFVTSYSRSGLVQWFKIAGRDAVNNSFQLNTVDFFQGSIYIQGTFTDSIYFDSLKVVYQNYNGFIAKLIPGSLTALSDYQVFKKELSIYPNPSSGKFTLQLNKMLKQVQHDGKICVYNILGNGILTQQITNSENQQIDLTGQAKGIYFVEINSGGERINKKVVVN